MYKNKKKKKIPVKRGSMVHSNRILVFSAIPPHLYPPLFDMNTFTLYFYQPTISRRWGPFTSSICTHLHDFSSWRGYIVARAIVSRDNTRRGSSPIDRWNDRSYYCTQKPRNKYTQIKFNVEYVYVYIYIHICTTHYE